MSEATCVLTPHAKPFDLAALELDGCGVVSFHVALHEHQRKAVLSHRFDQWPDDVQRVITREIEAWHKRNTERGIRLVSAACVDGVCVVILHHAGKAG